MPRIDKVGEEALVKAVRYAGSDIKGPDGRYRATLVADLAINAAYYAAIGTAAGSGAIWRRALTLGLAAGIGTVKLPAKLGLDNKPVTRTRKT